MDGITDALAKVNIHTFAAVRDIEKYGEVAYCYRVYKEFGSNYALRDVEKKLVEAINENELVHNKIKAQVGNQRSDEAVDLYFILKEYKKRIDQIKKEVGIDTEPKA